MYKKTCKSFFRFVRMFIRWNITWCAVCTPSYNVTIALNDKYWIKNWSAYQLLYKSHGPEKVFRYGVFCNNYFDGNTSSVINCCCRSNIKLFGNFTPDELRRDWITRLRRNNKRAVSSTVNPCTICCTINTPTSQQSTILVGCS